MKNVTEEENDGGKQNRWTRNETVADWGRNSFVCETEEEEGKRFFFWKTDMYDAGWGVKKS